MTGHKLQTLGDLLTSSKTILVNGQPETMNLHDACIAMGSYLLVQGWIEDLLQDGATWIDPKRVTKRYHYIEDAYAIAQYRDLVARPRS